ncbi:MAG: hypothetical protein QW360_03370, partial [Thermofilum sp.]
KSRASSTLSKLTPCAERYWAMQRPVASVASFITPNFSMPISLNLASIHAIYTWYAFAFTFKALSTSHTISITRATNEKDAL